ncbi:unnamed protein product [Caenorhabditis auriculariae]|uniref:Uncharacterized protein n=1 Tax=Caenorhabditis auriculariae TaxID=2777116 RepID=A0A8S1GT04_9PELO|nr:unnamed protein product [Caenorhabditis auriculariae]
MSLTTRNRLDLPELEVAESGSRGLACPFSKQPRIDPKRAWSVLEADAFASKQYSRLFPQLISASTPSLASPTSSFMSFSRSSDFWLILE